MTNKELFELRCAERDNFVKKMIRLEVLEERDGFVLQKSAQNLADKVIFKLLWDGECISMIEDEKEARKMFEDFAPAPKRKPGRPKKNVA